jgi:hypothetical protein
MPIQKLTTNDFAEQISIGIASRDKTLDTRISEIRDVFIDPISSVLESQNNRAVYLNNLLSLKNANNLVPDDVDDFVYNENIVRWLGSRVITVVTFARVSAPTSDITVPVNFPVSTRVNPTVGTSVVFRTIETKTMYASAASSYYNAETGKYELQVSVASVIQGTEANVGPYTITEFKRPLEQFDEVYNVSATSSGRGIETNEELANRYLLHIEGSQLATPSGIKSFILDNFSSVLDAYIVYGTDPYMTRDQFDVGAVDIWVMGESASDRVYPTYYNGVYTLNSVDKQPLMEVSSVYSVAKSTQYSEGTDYEVITGEGIYAYSTYSSDGIRWLPGGNHPDIGDDVIITYKYNSLINILNSFFNQPAYYTMGVDKLFRWAGPLYIEIDADLKVLSGSPSIILNLVRGAILNYINALKLGQSVEEFDISGVVSKIYGVDNFTYNQLSIKDGSGVGDIIVPPNFHARLEEADLVINLV